MAPWTGSALIMVAVAIISRMTTKGSPLCYMKGVPTAEEIARYRKCLTEAEQGPEVEHVPSDPESREGGLTPADIDRSLQLCANEYNIECESTYRLLDYFMKAYDYYDPVLDTYRVRRSVTTRTEDPLTSFPTTPAYLEMLQKYYSWRQKKGYGKTVGRWGRSVDRSLRRKQTNDFSGESKESESHILSLKENKEDTGRLLRLAEGGRYKPLVNGIGGFREKRSSEMDNLSLEKLKMNPNLMKMLYKYGAWRDKNGYGKLGGRYG